MEAKNLTHFDTLVRGPIFGYRGASRLFRNISCDAFVSQIETPLLVLTAKDDTITDFQFVPIDDLKRNPNVILAVLERGGHCNFFFQSRKEDGRPGEHQELAPMLAIEFFGKAQEFYSQNSLSTSSPLPLPLLKTSTTTSTTTGKLHQKSIITTTH